MASCVAAIDQGTTSTRVIVFNHAGEIRSIAQREHRQIYPRPGWVEHDSEEIWRRTGEVMEEACQHGGLAAKDIAAIGITNQRETTILWNRKTGEPVMNAIVWQDTRVDSLVSRFSANGGPDRFRPCTGLPLSTYFSSLKIVWMLENMPGIRQRVQSGDVLFGTVDSFLIWKLTGGSEGGVHVTDVTNASRTQLMNLSTLDWDEELLQTFDIPRAMLPRICSSAEVVGKVKDGILAGVPIAGVLGDQQAALVGQVCFNQGEAKNTYGTGCFLLMNTGQRAVQSNCGLITTVAYKFGEQAAVYALEGSIAVTGALVQWMRDNLGLIATSPEIEKLARGVEDNGGVYFVPAFSGLYAPYWKDNARGVIVGLTRYSNKGHLARAALEATAFQTREVVEAMQGDCGISLDVLRVDGGMTDNALLMQFQADILNRSIVRPLVKETTALGAAYAAGLATGFFKSIDELRTHWAASKTWNPGAGADCREKTYRMWKKAVTRSFDWVE
jgi:glycerol kinase